MRARPHAEWKEGWHVKCAWVSRSSVYFLSVTSGTNVSLHSCTYNHNRQTRLLPLISVPRHTFTSEVCACVCVNMHNSWRQTSRGSWTINKVRCDSQTLRMSTLLCHYWCVRSVDATISFDVTKPFSFMTQFDDEFSAMISVLRLLEP